MIGVARPSAFQRHAHIMLETLYPSMAAQTSRNFHWAVVTDELIDNDSQALIESRFGSHPNFHLEKIDPFAAGTNAIPVAKLCEDFFGTTKDIITTRIDDDDALHIDFVAEVQRQVEEARAAESPLVSLSFRKGMRIAAKQGRYDMFFAREGASAGMSLFSADVKTLHVHSFGHNKVHRRVQQKKGIALHVDTTAPFYLVGVHAGSASREKRDQEAAERRIKKNFTKGSPREPVYVGLLASFGLPKDFAEKISKLNDTLIDPRPGMLPPMRENAHLAMTRLTTKGAYLVMANRLRERKKAATGPQADELALDLHLIRQAYYSL